MAQSGTGVFTFSPSIFVQGADGSPLLDLEFLDHQIRCARNANPLCGFQLPYNAPSPEIIASIFIMPLRQQYVAADVIVNLTQMAQNCLSKLPKEASKSTGLTGSLAAFTMVGAQEEPPLTKAMSIIADEEFHTPMAGHAWNLYALTEYGDGGAAQ